MFRRPGRPNYESSLLRTQADMLTTPLLSVSEALLQSDCSSPVRQSWNLLVPRSTKPVWPLSAAIFDSADSLLWRDYSRNSSLADRAIRHILLDINHSQCNKLHLLVTATLVEQEVRGNSSPTGRLDVVRSAIHNLILMWHTDGV